MDKLKWIFTATTTVVLAVAAAFYFFKNEQQPTKWVYCGVIPINVTGVCGIKDPEFVRYPNHTVFKDDEGYYYIVASFLKQMAHGLPAP
ncbi:MAG: hypothetical protein ACUVTE_03910 [Candidatus Bathycorpusculaceae bacterium]